MLFVDWSISVPAIVSFKTSWNPTGAGRFFFFERERERPSLPGWGDDLDLSQEGSGV